MKLELITAEGPATLWMRKGRLIRFPQLTMPLLAALTPPDVEIHHTDEIVSRINFSRTADLVGITTTTCSAPHAYEVADEFRSRGVTVVLGGPHPTLLPDEAIQHADSILIGEAEGIWSTLIEDFQKGRLKRFYQAAAAPSLAGLPWARREYIPTQGLRTRGPNRDAELPTHVWLLHASTLLLSPVSLPAQRRGNCGSRLDSGKSADFLGR